MSKLDLERILNGDIAHIDEIDERRVSAPGIEATILPIHVKNMLLAYLNENISADDLIKWCRFIIFHDYNCKDWEIDEIADYYEDMFDVVHSITVPAINYEITPDNIKIYLKQLDKYFKDDAEK